MQSIRSTMIALPILLAMLLTLTFAERAVAELTLVQDGVDPAPIVVYDGALTKTRQAASELADYIERTSGARPRIIEGEPSDIPERAIWVGHQPVLDSLFPEIDFSFEHPEEILIAANENHLVIAGRDVWDPDHLVVHSRGGRVTVEDMQQEYGTVNAVYTFLQDYLDVRWFWPGETGIDVIERETIAFEPFEYRYHPQIRQRNTILRFSAQTWSNAPHSGDWSRRQRLQLDSMNAPIQGHGFGDWWERFGESNPEYFALQPDGTRSGFPGPGKAKLCQSNPAVWDQWVDDVAEKLEENPNQTIFNASPNDSYHRGICICDNCRAWDHPEGEMRTYTWEGVSQQYVAMSDRHVTFANKLGEALKERFPDRDLYVMMYAYGHSRPAPIEAVPADNVIICGVHNFHLRKRSAREEGRAHLDGWGEVTDQMLWRPNLGNGTVGWKQGMPDISITQAIEDYKFVAENGTIGISYDSLWQHWATQGVHYYITAHMAWNPDADGRAIMEDYYQRGFGPAAEDIKAYWTLMEKTRDRAANDPSIISNHYPQIYTQPVLSEAEALLDAAAEKVSGDEEHAARVAFIRDGFNYTKLVTEMAALKRRYEEGRKQDEQLAAQIEERWAQLDAMWARDPEEHIVNWTRLGADFGGGWRAGGLLPSLRPEYEGSIRWARD